MLKRSFFILVLILLAGVAGREIPECTALADDVSNDGEVVSYRQEEAVSACINRAFLQTEGTRVSTGSSNLRKSRCTLPARPTGLAAKRLSLLLRFLSLQRE